MAISTQPQFENALLKNHDTENFYSDSYFAPLANENAFIPAVSTKKKLTDLSRNLLVIVCEYLVFFEIVALTSANRKLLKQLDDGSIISNGSSKTLSLGDIPTSASNVEVVSYVKRRGTLFFQSFFFQQFPTSDVFIKRMISLTAVQPCLNKICHFTDSGIKNCKPQLRDDQGILTSAHCFLPFVKQSSICEEKGSSMVPPKLSKESSNNPFELC